MDWQKLLTKQRLGKTTLEESQSARTCFQQDYDRLVFSSPFRRLKDKTQVYSLAKNDYIRTRLTHSIEVSCVGRSLGTIVGYEILDKYKDELKDFSASDFGSIVSAACLAHDIGNPPFGHAGENAISSGFKKWNNLAKESFNEYEKADLERFEGNAQGFRILTCIEMPDRLGGMQLSCPTLAAFTKYPRESKIPNDALNGYEGKSIKKYGFFQSEKDLFNQVAETVGLISRSSESTWWSRHPLAFLVEAADDICYRIIDLEDGCRMGFIPFTIAKQLLNDIAQVSDEKINKNAGHSEETIKYLRAIAINTLVKQVAEIFIAHESEILEGKFDQELLSKSCHQEILGKIEEETKTRVFIAPEVISVQIAGYEVLGHLLAEFADAVVEDQSVQTGKSHLLISMLPEKYRPIPNEPAYRRIIKITDYISGMTDSYATTLFQTLKGISLNK
jgi:dGTPase